MLIKNAPTKMRLFLTCGDCPIFTGLALRFGRPAKPRRSEMSEQMTPADQARQDVDYALHPKAEIYTLKQKVAKLEAEVAVKGRALRRSVLSHRHRQRCMYDTDEEFQQMIDARCADFEDQACEEAADASDN